MLNVYDFKCKLIAVRLSGIWSILSWSLSFVTEISKYCQDFDSLLNHTLDCGIGYLRAGGFDGPLAQIPMAHVAFMYFTSEFAVM